MNPVIFVNEDLCKGVDGCGLCMHVCPKDVFEKSNRLTDRGIKAPEPVRPGMCTACKLCVIYCPDLAIVIEKAENKKGRRHKAEVIKK